MHTCPPGELEAWGGRSQRQDDSGVGAQRCRGRSGAWGCRLHRGQGVSCGGGSGRGPGVRAILPVLPTPTCTNLLAQQGLWKGRSPGQCHSRPKSGILAAPKGKAAVEASWRAELLGTEASRGWRVRTQVRMSTPPWGGLCRQPKHLTDRDHFLLPSPSFGPRPVVEDLLLSPSPPLPPPHITTITIITTITSLPSTSPSPPSPPPHHHHHHHYHCHHHHYHITTIITMTTITSPPPTSPIHLHPRGEIQVPHSCPIHANEVPPNILAGICKTEPKKHKGFLRSGSLLHHGSHS